MSQIDYKAKLEQVMSRLAAAVYRIDEVWESPEISGDIMSFWPDWFVEEIEDRVDEMKGISSGQ